MVKLTKIILALSSTLLVACNDEPKISFEEYLANDTAVYKFKGMKMVDLNEDRNIDLLIKSNSSNALFYAEGMEKKLKRKGYRVTDDSEILDAEFRKVLSNLDLSFRKANYTLEYLQNRS